MHFILLCRMKYLKGVSCVKNWKLAKRVIPLCLFIFVFSQYLYRNILSPSGYKHRDNEIVSAQISFKHDIGLTLQN